MADYAITFRSGSFAPEKIDVPPPGPGEVRIRQTAVGLSYADVLARAGGSSVLGHSAVGVVEAAGRRVDLPVGDRVAYATARSGAYASVRNVPAHLLVPVPDAVPDEDAAAVLDKGLLAWALLREVYPVRSGDTVVFHVAAGGVGLLAGQWLNHLGARAIGTVGSAGKVRLAAENGYDEVVLYRTDDLAARAHDLTEGVGVPVVYDPVGAATFAMSLSALRPRGLLVSFGSVSGPVTGVDLSRLAASGSVYVTRPRLADYLPDAPTLRAAAAELFELVTKGVIRPNLRQRFDLPDAGKAHEALESRTTVGATVLLP